MVLILMCTMLLAACGSDTNDTGGGSAPTPTATATSIPVTPCPASNAGLGGKITIGNPTTSTNTTCTYTGYLPVGTSFVTVVDASRILPYNGVSIGLQGENTTLTISITGDDTLKQAAETIWVRTYPETRAFEVVFAHLVAGLTITATIS